MLLNLIANISSNNFLHLVSVLFFKGGRLWFFANMNKAVMFPSLFFWLGNCIISFYSKVFFWRGSYPLGSTQTNFIYHRQNSTLWVFRGLSNYILRVFLMFLKVTIQILPSSTFLYLCDTHWLFVNHYQFLFCIRKYFFPPSI